MGNNTSMFTRSGKNLSEPSDKGNGKGKMRKERSDEMPPWAEDIIWTLNAIKDQNGSIKDQLEKNSNEMKSFLGKHKDLETQVIRHKEELKITKQKLFEATTHFERYENKTIDLETRSRQRNIQIFGLQEGGEDGELTAYFGKLFHTLFPTIVSQPPAIERAHRAFTSKFEDTNKPRSVLVCFHHFKIKDQIMRQARKHRVFRFKESELRFYEDYPKEVLEQRSRFDLVMKQAYDKLFPSLRYPTGSFSS
ncbi:uncharacterized protein [Mobula birostris]|uniref:uncharacterized protein n=1 Tax=Mobula birostris TaxID=1983395 RepID=UPI003B2814F8